MIRLKKNKNWTKLAQLQILIHHSLLLNPVQHLVYSCSYLIHWSQLAIFFHLQQHFQNFSTYTERHMYHVPCTMYHNVFFYVVHLKVKFEILKDSTNLDIERIEDNFLGCGNVKVQDCETHAMQTRYYFQKLLWSFLGSYFEICMGLYHCDFYVSNGRLNLSLLLTHGCCRVITTTTELFDDPMNPNMQLRWTLTSEW